MKRFVVLVLMCMLVLFTACDTNSVEANTDSVTESTAESEYVSAEDTQKQVLEADKAAMVEMFTKHGTYYDDGLFRFSNSKSEYGTYTIYTFSYNPKTEVFSCSYAVYTYETSSTPASGGSVNFQWGDVANGYWFGYHSVYDAQVDKRLDNLEFEYSVKNFNADMKLGDYTYKVVNNTFSNLSNSQIDMHALTSFDYIVQGINYSQGIISAYTDGISLW